MKTLCVPAFVVLTLVSAVMPLAAHHSWPVSFDRLVTVKGTVTEFRWANPHPMITLEVQANDGRMVSSKDPLFDVVDVLVKRF